MTTQAKMACNLRNAANVIRRTGLTKGTFFDADGSYCTVGALMHARCLNPIDLPSSDPEVALLATMLGWNGVTRDDSALAQVAEWNDADERTADDVITLLEQAAEKVEADA